MFTVKVEDIDGKSTLFQAKEVKCNYEVIQTYEEFEDTLDKFKDQDYHYGEWRNLNIPQNKAEFSKMKREIAKYFRSDYPDEPGEASGHSEDDDPLDEVRVRVGHLELFNKPGYRSISIFNSRIFIMNDEGQTVDKINLLR